MKYKFFAVAIVIYLASNFIVSCRPDNPIPPVTIDSTKWQVNTLMSNKDGSWWQYGTRLDTAGYRRFATGLDSNKLGYNMSFYLKKPDTSGWKTAEYFGIFDGKFVTLVDLDGSQTSYIPYVFYIDGSNINDQWSNAGHLTYGSISGDVTVNSTLKENNLNLSWNGHNFDSVIHVSSIMKLTTSGAQLGLLDVWFKKGLGIIKGESHINVFNILVVDYADSLIDYHIEP